MIDLRQAYGIDLKSPGTLRQVHAEAHADGTDRTAGRPQRLFNQGQSHALNATNSSWDSLFPHHGAAMRIVASG